MEENKYRKFYVEWWNIRKSTIYASVAIVLLAACATAAPKAEGPATETFQAALDSASEVPAPALDASVKPSGKATFRTDFTVFGVSMSPRYTR